MRIWGKAKALNKGRRFLGLSQTLLKCLGPFELARPALAGLSRAGVPDATGLPGYSRRQWGEPLT